MTHEPPLEVGPEELRRLLPLASWQVEKQRALNAWRIDPADVPRLLRKHEGQFTAAGVACRQGNAWRLVEPFGTRIDAPIAGGFLYALVSLVSAERDKASARSMKARLPRKESQ